MVKKQKRLYWETVFKVVLTWILQCSLPAPKGSLSFNNLSSNIAKSKLSPKYDILEKNENQRT